MKKNTYLLSLSLLLWVCGALSPLQAQKEAWNWFFGKNNHLRFSDYGSLIWSNNDFSALKSPFSYSDSQGNLLFYGSPAKQQVVNTTVPSGIYNRFGQLMPNGVMADFEVILEGAIPLPVPGQPGKYYVFSLTNADGGIYLDYTLRYTIIDMSLDAGKGDVVTKNEVIATGMVPGLSITAADTPNTYWLATVAYESSLTDINFYSNINVYKIDPTGITLVQQEPAISSAAAFSMRFSPDGKYLHYQSNVYDFNPQTGEITGFRPLNEWPLWAGNFRGEFSADSKVLYTFGPFTSGFCLSQFDLSASEPAATELILEGDGIGNFCAIKGGIQLAPDGQIYFNTNFSNHLYRIRFPSVIGPGCGVELMPELLNNNVFFYDMPQFPTHLFRNLGTVSQSTQPAPDNWMVLPNPATDVLHFQGDMPSGSRLQLLDVLGRTVLDRTLNDSPVVSVAALPRGWYLARLGDGRHEKSWKILLQ
jgi:hypothetical protein